MTINFENAIAIELSEKINIQFVKTNILFAFDNIELERTTEFEIPATAHNNAVLKMAQDEHFDGEGMRRRYACQLQGSGVTKDGWLYVSAYSNGVYKCVFVCGQLLGLSAIKDAGKLSELVETDAVCVYPSATPKAANASQSIWDVYEYVNEGGAFRPSYNLQYLVSLALEKLGYSIEYPNEQIFRVIPHQLNIAPARDNGLRTTIQKNAPAYADYTSDPSAAPVIQATQLIEMSELIERSEDLLDVQNLRGRGNVYGKWRHIVPAVNISIAFSDAVDKYYFIRYLDTTAKKWVYLGGYTFIDGTRVLITDGEPLTGRTITIEAGQPFMLFKAGGIYDGNDGIYDYVQAVAAVAADSGQGDIPLPCYLSDNLPDLTIIDAVKTIAALNGRVLDWDEERGVVKFDEVDLQSWKVLDISRRVVEVNDLTRTFADYGRDNVINFDNASNVAHPLSFAYIVDNDNIEPEKELYKIPFSAGDPFEYESNGETFVGYRERSAHDSTDKPAITRAESGRAGWDILQRVEIPGNEGLAELCEASTRLQVVCVLPLVLFENITPQTLIYYNAAQYVWTAANWSDGKCSLDLQRLKSDAITPPPPPITKPIFIIYQRFHNADGTYFERERSRFELSEDDIGREYDSAPYNDFSGYQEIAEHQTGIIQGGENIIIWNHYPKVINCVSYIDDAVLDVFFVDESHIIWSVKDTALSNKITGYYIDKNGNRVVSADVPDIVSSCTALALSANVSDMGGVVNETAKITHCKRLKIAGQEFEFYNNDVNININLSYTDTWRRGLFYINVIAEVDSAVLIPAFTIIRDDSDVHY